MLSERLASFIPQVVAVCQRQFPKQCMACGKIYPSFVSYIEGITPTGPLKIDQIEDEDPIGLMSFGNCACGSTLTLKCEPLNGHASEMHRLFNEALKQEGISSNRPADDIVSELRTLVRQSALHEA